MIKVGDLVVVVRWPCCGNGLGRISTVVGFLLHRADSTITGVCEHCKTSHGYMDIAEMVDKRCWPLSWIKKIPPLSELEGTKEATEEKNKKKDKCPSLSD